MSENQSKDDINFKEKGKEDEKPKIQTSLENTNFKPIKTRIRQLEKDISELRGNLNENKKSGMIIKGDIAILETTIKEKCNELCK